MTTRIALVAIGVAVVVSCSKGGSSPTAPTPQTSPTANCGKQYCGQVSFTRVELRSTPVGFGWNWTGYVDIVLTPPPASGIPIQINLDGFSISGRATVFTGQHRIDLSGSSLSCPFDRDRQFVVFDGNNNVLAFLPIRWDTGARC